MGVLAVPSRRPRAPAVTAPVATAGRHRSRTTGAGALVPLTLVTFITALDNTVVNVALPRMRDDLRLSTAQLEWVVTSYVLVFACLMLVGGRLADRIGRRRTLLAGLVVFATGSTGCAIAPDAITLICGRAVQGVGSALILPASLAIMATDVPSRLRQLGVGVATGGAAAALALGPVIGGFIAQSWHWSGIFLINLPIVGLAALLTVRTVEVAPASSSPRGGYDALGVVLSCVGLGALTWALIESTTRGWDDGVVLIVGCTAVLVLIGFGAAQTLARAPLVDPELFEERVFTGSLIAQVLWGLGVNGVFLFTSLFLQDVLRLSPSRAGLCFVPLAVTLILVVPAVDPLTRRLGARSTVSLGLVLVAAGIFAVSRVGRHDGALDLLPSMLLIGVGSALTVPLTAVALATLGARQSGAGSAVITAGRELAGVFGVAIIGAVLIHRRDGLLRTTHDPIAAFLGGYRTGLEIASAVVVLGALVALTTLPPRKDPA